MPLPPRDPTELLTQSFDGLPDPRRSLDLLA